MGFCMDTLAVAGATSRDPRHPVQWRGCSARSLGLSRSFVARSVGWLTSFSLLFRVIFPEDVYNEASLPLLEEVGWCHMLPQH